MPSRDFRDLFAAFNAEGVEYLLVGAHALAVHGHLRATKDLDVWVRPSMGNAERVIAALRAFGAPTDQVTVDDFARVGITFQIGVDPLRIDILTTIDGVSFDEAWANRVQARFNDQSVNVISKGDLILNKRSSGRTQDLADLEQLEK
jgi:hypothetical protein